jgi:hypothetical protein
VVRAREGLDDGLRVGLPLAQALDVDPGQLPLLEGVALALQEPLELRRAPDVEPDLDERMPSPASISSKGMTWAKKRSRSSGVQKPKTWSTTPRLYQERSKRTISPFVGSSRT